MTLNDKAGLVLEPPFLIFLSIKSLNDDSETFIHYKTIGLITSISGREIMYGKKEFIYARYSLVLIAILILIAFSGTSLAKTNVDRTVTIDLNKFHNVPIIEAKQGKYLMWNSR